MHDQPRGGGVDSITISQSGGTPDTFIRLLIPQGSTYYYAVPTAINSLSWVSRPFPGLTASDFQRIGTTGSLSPDFSASGSAILFGYGTSTASNTGGPASLVITSGVDNWRVTVNSVVPEPSSQVSAALGLVALAGYAGWRRTRLRRVT